ncbi:hypothetical protein CTheo_6730 [Ceratobasidium theobromae]|uniref:Uncharacterized protein n=1 Tax=Ceratobasidium theobromae TaxID=1582974 RepID=A0A5N5QEE9_9AGAM|nr:hypothetical protein CTheo_6730 [Ceratobasidium theobromae]
MSRVVEVGTPTDANKAIGGVPTLHYFDFLSRGRGEVIRLFFEDAGIAFKDHRLAFDDYNAQVQSGEINKINPLKSLPAVEMGGTMYTQSYPLLRLWARQLGKYDGKNDLERYYVDAMTDIASDWRSKFVDSGFRASETGVGPRGDSGEIAYHKTFTVPKYAAALNVHLSTDPLSSGGPFVLGEEVTYADFVIFQIVHDDDWAGLDNNPRLNELVQAVKARPRVAAASSWLVRDRNGYSLRGVEKGKRYLECERVLALTVTQDGKEFVISYVCLWIWRASNQLTSTSKDGGQLDDRNYVLGGSERVRAENKALLDELDRKKRARTMAVPTDDNRVKARLREIGEPITLFGERAGDRRERLIYVLSQIRAARGGDDDIEMEDESSSSDEEEVEEFYTEGSLELLEARRRIAEYSLPRAQLRVAQQREESRLPLGKIIDTRKRVFAEVKKFTTYGSQIGDERPISQVRFSPDAKLLATGSWSGNVKLWNVPGCDLAKSYRAHGDRVGGVAWHPQATLTQSPDSVNIVTGGADLEVSLWSLNSDKALHTFKGHADRVCRVAFHPSGQYVASASYDGSWRLWDASTGQNTGSHVPDRQLLFQEGHSKEVYAVQFQDDGALVASGGLDAIGRVWDLRTGRTAMVLDGHGQAIYGMDFSPNGYQIATASGDNTIRIWDMRSLRALYTIGAHTSIVSDVSFYRPLTGLDVFTTIARGDAKMEDGEKVIKKEEEGDVKMEEDKSTPVDESKAGVSKSSAGTYLPVPGLLLVSSGYDGMVKLWSADDWQLVKAMSADAGKVMSADISPDGDFIASGSWNRSYQLYAMEG